MKNRELKVLLHLKKTTTDRHTIAQFSAKLKCPPDLWDKHKGRLRGKNTEALRVNRAIEKINLSVHNHYKKALTLAAVSK